MHPNLQALRASLTPWRAAFAPLLTAALSSVVLGVAQAQTDYQVTKFLVGVGSNPTALIEGTDHRLYGTLNDGGRKGEGVVFKLNLDGSGYTALHDFTGYRSGQDGSGPQGVVEGSDGALYGTTQNGGQPGDALHETGQGTVFKVNKDGSGYLVLHRFSGSVGDGIEPWAGLVEGHDGALYGTTLSGGTKGFGTVFKLNKDGSGYAVLHSFPESDADGGGPMAGLLAGRDGALYGTTDGGGSALGRNGTVFRLNPDGSGYKVLHNFPQNPGDGRFPRSSLVEGRDGALYGTTQHGGTNDAGAVFKLNKDGGGYAVVHSFAASLGMRPDPRGLVRGVFNGVPTRFSDEGDEGYAPTGLVQGSGGALYGMTKTCSTNSFATMFKLSFGVSRPTPSPASKCWIINRRTISVGWRSICAWPTALQGWAAVCFLLGAARPRTARPSINTLKPGPGRFKGPR